MQALGRELGAHAQVRELGLAVADRARVTAAVRRLHAELLDEQLEVLLGERGRDGHVVPLDQLLEVDGRHHDARVLVGMVEADVHDRRVALAVEGDAMLGGQRAHTVLQTDGGLKTGRDVAMAAAFGDCSKPCLPKKKSAMQ